MAKPVRKISDKDFNTLIEKAYYLTNQEHIQADTKEHDFEALKKVAAEMGIPSDKLEQAYQQMLQEKEAEAARAEQQQRMWIWVAAGVSAVVFIVWIFWPKTFSGTVQVSIAKKLNRTNYLPLEVTDTITTTNASFFVHALINGDYGDAVQWELHPPDDGVPIQAEQISYVESSKGVVAYQLFSLAPQMPLGEWKAVLKIFDKKVAEKSFVLVKGTFNTQITFTRDIDNNFRAIQNLNGYEALTDTVVMCHVTFRELTANNIFKVVWEYYDPEGSMVYTNHLDLKPTSETYYAYSPMMIDYRSIKTGKWKVKLLIDGEPVNERSFDISVGNANVTLTSGMKNDKPVNRTSVFKSDDEVYGYVYWPKINQRKILLTWKVKDSKGNIIRSIDQQLSNKGGTDWWAYRKVLEPNEAVPGNYTMELWGGTLLMAERNFEIVK
jgi:hypothetical protein